MTQIVAWILLLTQTVMGAVPQASLRCLTCAAEQCACVASETCCDECRQESAPNAPVECPCVTERQPVAAIEKSSIEFEPLFAVAWLPLEIEPLRLAALPRLVSWQADTPTIPLQKLFCTWLK